MNQGTKITTKMKKSKINIFGAVSPYRTSDNTRKNGDIYSKLGI